jgi:hypothetical protein
MQTEVTSRMRTSPDANDAGGRLGAVTDGGTAPDARNMRVLFEPCRDGDIVVCLSGVAADNLDPRLLGTEPSDLGQSGSWGALR